MKTNLLVSALVALIVSVLVIGSGPLKPDAPKATSVYDQVMNTGVLRVGYVNVLGGFNVDPQTKQMSGVFHDVLEEMAKNMGLKIEYVEEVGWSTMMSGLQTKRYDMIASPVWPNSSRAKQASFSNPVYYSAIGIWVRQNEDRFVPEGGWASIDKPEIKIGAFDGSTGEKIVQTMFPHAQLVAYPEMAGEGQVFLDVASGKVDIFFEEVAKGARYVKNNPDQVKNIAAQQPVKVFPNVFLLPAGDVRMKEMIDTALAELQNSGFVERAMVNYEPVPNAYYRVAPSYQ